MDKNNKENLDNIIYLDDYIRIPENYDQDVYVDLNNPIDWSLLNKKEE